MLFCEDNTSVNHERKKVIKNHKTHISNLEP